MFGISWSELLVIFIVVIIFVDPKDIPALARHVADFIKKLKSISNDFSTVINKELVDPKKYIKDLNGKLQETLRYF